MTLVDGLATRKVKAPVVSLADALALVVDVKRELRGAI